jgi:Ser-tRNA(Ala) deacylase AlaX
VEYRGKIEYTPCETGDGAEVTAGAAPAPPAEAELIAALMDRVEELIGQALPTEVCLVPRDEVPKFCSGYTTEELLHYPESVRLVRLAGQFIPCGGTHVASSAELTGLHISKIKHKKGVVKVSYSLSA